MKKKKFIVAIVSLFVTVGTLFQGALPAVFADGIEREVEATVTKLEVQTEDGRPSGDMWYTDRFLLSMDWDASGNGSDMHEGDFFDITLPNEMKFPSDSDAVDFDIYSMDGTDVIGAAHVTPGLDDKGGYVRITFNNWVEGKENIHGNIRLSAQFSTEDVAIGEENFFNVSTKSQVVFKVIFVTGPTELKDELVGKWSSTTDRDDEAAWWVRINHKKANLTDVVITDTLSEGVGTETFLKDSFELTRVEFNSYGDEILKVYEQIDLTDKLTFSPDGKTFTINLGDVNGDQYHLTYRTNATINTALWNTVTVTANEESVAKPAAYFSADSDGLADGSPSKEERPKMDLNCVEVSVKKEWVGPKTDSVTIHLYADGVDTGKSIELSEENNWEGVFQKLAILNESGELAQYTVKEDVPEGYECEITGSMENGFVVTNTGDGNIPKTGADVEEEDRNVSETLAAPKTGDESKSTWLYMGLGIASLILLNVMWFRASKRK